MARGRDLDVTGDFEICAGCAIEVARHRGYLDRIASPRRRRGRGQRKFETLRDIIFDKEARSPDRSGFRIGKSVDAPGFRRNAGQQRERKNLAVVFLILPAIALAGLTMSPNLDSIAPQLVILFGGRQSARTIYFLCAAALVTFLLVHVLMVLLSGVWNNMRSMTTGWYRIEGTEDADDGTA